MAAPREDPLAYNGWAQMASKMDMMSDPEEDAASDLMPQPIPVGPPPGDPDYEFECPAASWIALVEACRLEYVSERNLMVMKIMFLAKNSHWTDALYQEELHLLDVEYGGDTQELSSPEVSQPPHNPCATCGVDTGSDRMFCDKHLE